MKHCCIAIIASTASLEYLTLLAKSILKTLEIALEKKAKKKFVDIQSGDVSKTWSNNTLLFNLINYKPSTTINEGINKFVDWYLKYYDIKIKLN